MRFVAWLERRFVSLEEEIGRPRHLDATLQQVPQLAAKRKNLTVMAKMLAGVLRLGQAVRAFIGQMSKGASTTEVANAIPDIIRGVQHLEE